LYGRHSLFKNKLAKINEGMLGNGNKKNLMMRENEINEGSGKDDN
jgi:hypothetical protein